MLYWETITKFGDVALLGPVAAAIALWLTFASKRHMALFWCLSFAGAMSLVALTKIAFMGWGVGESHNFTGISGHTTAACAVIPVLLFLCLQNTRPLIRIYGVALGILFGICIGISRLAVEAHSLPEVVAGCMLGCLVSVSFIVFFSPSTPLSRPTPARPALALSMVVLFAFSFTDTAPTQVWLEHIAMAVSGRDKPVVRKVGLLRNIFHPTEKLCCQ